jgi:hypothetical protein
MSLVSVDLDHPLRAATPSETALTRRIDLTTLRLFIAVCTGRLVLDHLRTAEQANKAKKHSQGGSAPRNPLFSGAAKVDYAFGQPPCTLLRQR